MDTDDLALLARQIANDSRAVLTLVESDLFKNLYVRAKPASQDLVELLVESIDAEGVKRWVEEQKNIQSQYEAFNVRELRRMASRACIPDYQILTKLELIQQLEERRK